MNVLEGTVKTNNHQIRYFHDLILNYFIKNNEFKNFDNLNNRARHFTIKLIKKQCLEKKITKHDYIIKWYEEYFNKPKAEKIKYGKLI